MADSVIFADSVTGAGVRKMERGIVWTSPTVGYVFFKESATADFKYTKTTDGGVSWAAAVSISVDINTFSIWYDKWTPGDNGGKIHFAYGRTAASDLTYGNLDTAAADGLTQVIIDAAVTPTGSPDWAWAVTKARGGNLYCGGWMTTAGAGADRGFWRSVNGGVAWTKRADVTDGAALDKLLLFPGNEADDQDVYCAYVDDSAQEVTLKVYDDSGNSWSETVIAALSGAPGESNPVIAGGIKDSDNHLMLMIQVVPNGSAGDIEFWDITDAATMVQRTDVATHNDFLGTAITIDQENGVIYAVYVRNPAPFNVADIFYKTSPDGGVTWGTAIRFNDSPASAGTVIGGMWTDLSIGAASGRFMPCWIDEGPADLMTNVTNSVVILPPAGTPVPPPVTHSPGGSFNRVLSGGAGGFIAYISPDGREYPLHTPHQIGRWVVSFSGFGTPPIDYITQRGPFQHGVTVKDFFLQPRVIQLLIRQAFCDRVAWWAGRAALLNEIRPNRQATATGAVPGTLRIVETDGTTRDLSVFITEGPRFEPRVSGEWDEWAFMEALRFIAHDPVAFDPTQVTASFTIALAASLVFPITFPITFGTGVVDDTLAITYPGTWLTFPVITIVGPIDLPRIDNNTTGEKIEFTIDIAAGRTITIDLTEGNKTVVDDLGTNLIGAITSDSDLGTFHIAPDPEAPGGVNTLRLRGDNPTGATSVSLAYFERYFGF